ncbi:MAG: dihydroneopterin aldolase family protein [Methanomassiliicoccaceae archaeon]|nr:dihydroneopterin aldolase family protein [Methanomassiliicoccaceae archaeon]
MTSREEKASRMFGCSERERALFEAGVKMGAVYHQFVGTPVSPYNVAELEKTIEHSVMVQPFVESASVNIKINMNDEKKDVYDYVSLKGEMIDAVIRIKVNGVSVTAEMRYLEELEYPLMYVSDVSQ